MGNSRSYLYLRALLKHPGVVVMHGSSFCALLRIWMALNSGKRRDYVSLMEANTARRAKEAARRVVLGPVPEALFKSTLSATKLSGLQGRSHYYSPLYILEGLVRGIRAILPVGVVPMGVPLPRSPEGWARAYIGSAGSCSDDLRFGLNPYKRVSATLRAFKPC